MRQRIWKLIFPKHYKMYRIKNDINTMARWWWSNLDYIYLRQTKKALQ